MLIQASVNRAATKISASTTTPAARTQRRWSTSKCSLRRGHEPRSDYADTAAARGELGWEPKFDLEAGIRDWGKWFKRTGGTF